eukprot:scaffold47_cov334-Pavlova_lutheri.AAC.12
MSEVDSYARRIDAREPRLRTDGSASSMEFSCFHGVQGRDSQPRARMSSMVDVVCNRKRWRPSWMEAMTPPQSWRFPTPPQKDGSGLRREGDKEGFVSKTSTRGAMEGAATINPNPILVARAERPLETVSKAEARGRDRRRFGLLVDLPTEAWEDDGNTRLNEAREELMDAVEGGEDEMDEWEVFEHVRDIMDPEHPHTLEELGVVSVDKVAWDQARKSVQVEFAPTVPHCSMATLIGLSLRVKLERSLPKHCKKDVVVHPGSHASEDALNKQLADKERVAAALENPKLREMVDQCLANSE